jgi:hypothetical protein
MTQLEQLKDALSRGDVINVLLLVRLSQNAPPLGKSDGSIPQPVWMAARKLVTAHALVREAEMELECQLKLIAVSDD